MHMHFKPLIDWIHANPEWAEWMTFLIAFSESIALIGLLIPGSVLLMAIGTLVGSDVIPLWTTLFAAIAGAIIGDLFSFGLGYFFSETVLHCWPLSRFPTLMARGKYFFEKHGGKSVFIGRFCGPIRPITPLIAGTLRMSPWRFLVATSLSACGWAPAYMLPGFLLGAASLTVAPRHVTQIILLLLLFCLILWMVYWIMHYVLSKTSEAYHAALASAWQVIKAKRSIAYALFYDADGSPHGQLGRALGICLLAITFSVLVMNVISQGPLTDWNIPVNQFFLSLRNPLADRMMLMVSSLGEPLVIACLFMLMSLYWLANRRFWILLHWLALGLFSFASIYAIKHGVHEARPLGNTVIRATSAFPSGHVGLSLCVYGFLGLLLVRARPAWRVATYSSVACIVTAIAISRLYLNVHWLNDVVGSMLWGLCCINVVFLSLHHRSMKPLTPPRLLIFTLLLSLLCMVGFYCHGYQRELQHITLRAPAMTKAHPWLEVIKVHIHGVFR